MDLQNLQETTNESSLQDRASRLEISGAETSECIASNSKMQSLWPVQEGVDMSDACDNTSAPTQHDSRPYTGRITVHENFDPPRRLMEEELEALLERRGEPSLVTIEYDGQDVPERAHDSARCICTPTQHVAECPIHDSRQGRSWEDNVRRMPTLSPIDPDPVNTGDDWQFGVRDSDRLDAAKIEIIEGPATEPDIVDGCDYYGSVD